MESLARANLDGLQAAGVDQPANALLSSLWRKCLAGGGKAIKASPFRTVFRVASGGQNYSLKICHPRRAGNFWRNLIRKPPAIREVEAAWEFSSRFRRDAESFAQAVGEQVNSSFGLAARPWLDGDSGEEISPENLGKGLANLHQCGWRDADVCAQDLLFFADRSLLPMDFGQSVFVRSGHRPSMKKDLVRLLVLESDRDANLKAPALLDSHGHVSGCDWNVDEILSTVRKNRLRDRWKQSGTCLRDSSSFETTKNGFRRRNRKGGKEFQFLTSSGKLAFRKFYWLELLSIPVPRVASLRQDGPSDCICLEDFPEGHVLTETHLAPLRKEMNAQGLDLDPFLAEDFRMNERGPVLISTERLVRIPISAKRGL